MLINGSSIAGLGEYRLVLLLVSGKFLSCLSSTISLKEVHHVC
jgi:hypothetical protein